MTDKHLPDKSLHISPKHFEEVIFTRLQSYYEAIFGTLNIGGTKQRFQTTLQYNIEKIQQLLKQADIISGDLWGYGINNISDGENVFNSLDVEDIRYLPGINRNLEQNRLFNLLLFKFDKGIFSISIFVMNVLRPSVTAILDTRYKAQDFEYARKRIQGQNIFLDIIFNTAKQPVTFQIDTYNLARNYYTNDGLAEYYKTQITQLCATNAIGQRVSPQESKNGISATSLTSTVSSAPVQSNKSNDITIYDKVMRQLTTVEVIFKVQSSKVDPAETYPFILNFKGTATDGRLIHSMNIYSDFDLFNLQSYKQEFTQRFESAVNTTHLLNQLSIIKTKCENIVSYYKRHLGDGSPAMLALRKNIPADFNLRREYLDYHSSVITIHRYQISEIYFDAHRNKMPDFLDMSKFKYNYYVNNQDLLLICLHLIEFVDTFFSVQPKVPIVDKKSEKKQFTSLEELFLEPEDFKKAISALFTIGVINDKFENKIGNPLKGVVQVWVKILRQSNKLRDISDADLTILVNRQFVGVNISEKSDGKHFRNINRSAANKYGKKLKELLG